MSIRTIADVEALEQSAIPVAGIRNTYELIARTASRYPDHLALSFFVHVEDRRPGVELCAQDDR